jgi:methyl-accepting chemotaxis protein
MYQRSRYLIDPKVQWSIAGLITYHWAIFLLCLMTISAIVQAMVAAGHQPFLESLWTAARAQVPILGMMVLMLPIFLRDMLKMTNRFAGPMFRLRTSLADLAQNRSTAKIRFRSRDFWQEVAEDFNSVLGRIETLKKQNATLREKNKTHRSETEELEREIAALKAVLAESEKSLENVVLSASEDRADQGKQVEAWDGNSDR